MKLPKLNWWQWLIIAFVVFYVVTQPENAAGFVKAFFGWIETIADGASEFVTETAA